LKQAEFAVPVSAPVAAAAAAPPASLQRSRTFAAGYWVIHLQRLVLS